MSLHVPLDFFQFVFLLHNLLLKKKLTEFSTGYCGREAGPNRAKDSAQPVNKVSPSKKPKIFFILPFIFPYFKQRFVCYKTNESLKMSLYIIQPIMEVLIL